MESQPRERQAQITLTWPYHEGTVDRKNWLIGWQTNYLILANGELLFYKNPTDAYTCLCVSLFKLKTSVKRSFDYGVRQLVLETEEQGSVLVFFPTMVELRAWQDVLLDTEDKIVKMAEDMPFTIPVFFSDSEYFPFTIEKKTTAEELWWKACEETHIPLEARNCFFLWTIGRELQLLLSNGDVISEVMEKWEEAEVKFVGGRQSHIKLVLRSTYRVPLKEEEKMTDDTSVSLFFAEAMFHFVNGHYVLPFDEMITCGAVIARTKYGEWNPDIQYELILPYIVPAHFIRNHGAAIAQNVSDKHKIIKDKKTDVRGLRRKLLRTLRTQRSYGSTFFRASDEIRNRRTSLWQLEQYGSCIIAVNSCGIHFTNIIDEICDSYSFDQVTQWAVHNQYLWFEVEKEDGRNAEMIFKSKFASLIKSYFLELAQVASRPRDNFTEETKEAVFSDNEIELY